MTCTGGRTDSLADYRLSDSVCTSLACIKSVSNTGVDCTTRTATDAECNPETTWFDWDAVLFVFSTC